MIRSVFLLAFLWVAGTSQARAQVHVQIDIGLPVAPPLVVIQPGLQVVEGFGEEVFFHGGWYWCRRYDGWYRSRTPRSRFVWVEERRVPRLLVEVPRGHYRNWHHERDLRHTERREERWREERRREERREQRREDRNDDRRELRREERREERHESRERERERHRDH